MAEVLLALSLVIAVVVLIAGIFPYSYQVDQKAWQKSSAQRLAASELERLRAADFDSLAGSSNTVRVEQVPFVVTTTVTNTTPPPVKAKNVVCQVEWRTPNGTEKYIQETRIVKLYRPEE